MTDTTDRRPVVVGIDDSDGARLAVDWAVETASRYGAPLRLVATFQWLLPYWWGGAAYADARDLDVTRQAAVKLVDATLDRLRSAYPELDVTGEAVEGDPVVVLERESERATMIVLGSRRLGGLGSFLLGSVGTGVSARAACPVVVVRGPAGDPAERAGVVVGVDGSEASANVLGFAFEFAARYELPLRAVLCWRPDALAWPRRDDDPVVLEQAAAWLEASIVAGWQERYPQVAVRTLVIPENAVAGLVAEAAGAHLLVVGTRGRGAVKGALLGSVSQGVLHHAACPVAVVGESPVSSVGGVS